jgi:hypothetical protein
MGGRVVEGTGLENRQARKGLVGSNPTPSAKMPCSAQAWRFASITEVSDLRFGLGGTKRMIREKGPEMSPELSSAFVLHTDRLNYTDERACSGFPCAGPSP